jgi:hypothetical protein
MPYRAGIFQNGANNRTVNLNNILRSDSTVNKGPNTKYTFNYFLYDIILAGLLLKGYSVPLLKC